MGVSLIPAFGTLYQRLTLPESTRFIASQDKSQDVMTLKKQQAAAEESSEEAKTDSSAEVEVEEVLKKKAHFRGVYSCFISSLIPTRLTSSATMQSSSPIFLNGGTHEC